MAKPQYEKPTITDVTAIIEAGIKLEAGEIETPAVLDEPVAEFSAEDVIAEIMDIDTREAMQETRAFGTLASGIEVEDGTSGLFGLASTCWDRLRSACERNGMRPGDIRTLSDADMAEAWMLLGRAMHLAGEALDTAIDEIFGHVEKPEGEMDN